MNPAQEPGRRYTAQDNIQKDIYMQTAHNLTKNQYVAPRSLSGYGIDYELPIGRAAAKRLLAGVDIPRMGHEVVLRSSGRPGVFEVRMLRELALQNISGTLVLASCTNPVSDWEAAFNFSVADLNFRRKPGMPQQPPPHLPFRVTLREDLGDQFQVIFDCYAANADEAETLAEDAHPGYVVETVIEFDHGNAPAADGQTVLQ